MIVENVVHFGLRRGIMPSLSDIDDDRLVLGPEEDEEDLDDDDMDEEDDWEDEEDDLDDDDEDD